MSSLSSASASRATARLNASQLRAATYGLGSGGDVRRVDPLLILAGAGTGKTLTLAHRAAELARYGLDPRRLLLLTFTRRAAREMGRRASRILALSGVAGSGEPSSTASAGQRLGSVVRTGSVPADAYLPWSGTFHSVGARLLRHFGGAIGLVPTFTVLDRGDAEDLMDLERQRLGLANQRRRVPRKGTCLSIYSRCVNARLSLDACLDEAYPWCADHEPALRRLFRAYVEAKQRRCVLDYDDLLLYWAHLMEQPAAVARITDLFDHVLVDEYQDTNALQAEILMALRRASRRHHGSRRRRSGDLFIPRLERSQHPDVCRTLRSSGRCGEAGGQLPVGAADSRCRQRGITAGDRGHRQGAAVALALALALGRPGHGHGVGPTAPHRGGGRCRTGGLRCRSCSGSARVGRGSTPPDGAVPHRAPQRCARARAHATEYPVREVRWAAVPRGGARQGPAVPASLAREPARWPGLVPRAAAAARGRAAWSPARAATD